MGLFKSSVLALVLVGGFSAFAVNDSVICKRVITVEPTENGPKITPQDYGIQVFENGSGWIAEIVQGKECTYERIVEVGQLTDFAEAKYVASIVAPQIDWSSVTSIRYASVGAPKSDRTATIIYEINGRDGKRLTTVVRTGWSVGVCGI